MLQAVNSDEIAVDDGDFVLAQQVVGELFGSVFPAPINDQPLHLAQVTQIRVAHDVNSQSILLLQRLQWVE